MQLFDIGYKDMFFGLFVHLFGRDSCKIEVK